VSKNAVRPMNNSKNKLNSEIIYNFNLFEHLTWRQKSHGGKLTIHAYV